MRFCTLVAIVILALSNLTPANAGQVDENTAAEVVKATFDMIDADKSGDVDADEIIAFLEGLGVPLKLGIWDFRFLIKMYMIMTTTRNATPGKFTLLELSKAVGGLIFDFFDKSNDGIELIEIQAVLAVVKFWSPVIVEFGYTVEMANFDENSDNKIQLSEFTHGKLSPTVQAVIGAMFRFVDMDGNGGISKTELQHLAESMGATLNLGAIDGIFAFEDVNGDGVIDSDELLDGAMLLCFRLVDGNGDDAITSTELKDSMKNAVKMVLTYAEEAVDLAFGNIDTSGNGSITRTELNVALENLFG